jgi:cytochrome c peroxidase
MNMPDKAAVVQVVQNSGYANLFRKVFGANALDDADAAYDNIARAIAAYERSPEVQRFSSRFDMGTLTAKERSGMDLFAANCSNCHSMTDSTGKRPLFTDYTYVNIGVPKSPNPDLVNNDTDYGLGGYLGDPSQNGKFKVPTLRNVALTAPYAHNGYFPTLKDMVNFKNTRDAGGWDSPEVVENITDEVGNLGLTAEEVDDIVAFLMTLTDG